MDNHRVNESTSRYPIKIEVAPYSASHRVAAVAIFREAFGAPPWDEDWSEFDAYQRLERVRGAPGGRGWVACDRGRPLGFALGSEVVALDGQRRAFLLQEMAVEIAHQCQGAGTALLRAIEEWALRAGLQVVEIVTGAGKWPCYFYEKNGYAVAAEEGVHVILSKELGGS